MGVVLQLQLTVPTMNYYYVVNQRGLEMFNAFLIAAMVHFKNEIESVK